MQEIEFPKDKFLKLKPLKNGIVHTQGKYVYKYNSSSEEIVELLYDLRYEDINNNLTLPIKKLYDNGWYYGFIMIKKDYMTIKDAQKSIYFNNSIFLKKLITIIAELNSYNIIYWDFHNKNISVNLDYEPLLFDLDEVWISKDKIDYNLQKKCLLEFILNFYFDLKKTLQYYLLNVEFKKCFSNQFIKYITSIFTEKTNNDIVIPEYFFDELNEKQKSKKLKLLLK